MIVGHDAQDLTAINIDVDQQAFYWRRSQGSFEDGNAGMRTARPLRRLVTRLTAALVLAFSAQADESVSPKLTPNLRQLLQQEMIAVRQASQEILDALVMGRDDVVASRAQAIHDSFIMAWSLTDEERQILKQTLPPAFVALDKNLHATAGAQSAAARTGNRPGQHKPFAAMIDICAMCHA